MGNWLLRLFVISGMALTVGACAKTPSLPSPQTTTKAATTQVAVSFEHEALGQIPHDFATALTGGGGAVRWMVKEDAAAPGSKKVLVQASTDATDYRFPLCVYSGLSAKDVDVRVRFKAITGQVDQAAGIVIRFKDKDNYYVVRANALEDNVRLYRVVGGKRQQFAAANTKVTSGQWHKLALSAEGTHFRVSFDDQPLFEAEDSTFPDAGKIGLWTKADSVTAFDDLQMIVHDPR